jgi:CRP/FNR family transcriptional regulator, cyclic AMP receptor protein
VTPPTVSDPVEQAWSRSFLARLPQQAQEQLKATAHEQELFVGQNVYRELRQPRFSFLALMVSGMLRAYATSPQGRRIVTRYWRPGQVVGLTSVVLHGAPAGIEVVRQGSMLRLDPLTLERLGRTNVEVAWEIAVALAERIVTGAEVRIPSVFGSVKVRVAWHLLELATEINGRCVVRTTQQDLADSVGSVREVVARVLLALTAEGMIVREGGVVVIRDPERLRLFAQSFDE